MEIITPKTSSLPVAFVTGATGFMGGHLARRLVREGWHVKVLVRNKARLYVDLRDVVQVIEGDLADTSALKLGVSGSSVIFHCAANVKTWDSWDAYYTTNVTGTQTLLETIAVNNPLARLVYISTADVYGFPIQPCNEQAATPQTGLGYGDSKRRAERLVHDFCGMHNIPYVIIRPTNVIGEGSQFIERIGKELQSGLMLTIDKGRANAGIVAIDNLVDYLLWAACAERAVSECYNVRDDYDVTWAEFIARLRKSLRGRGLVVDLPFGVADAIATVFEMLHRAVLPSYEPLLHRLLVRIFGRTCGHNAEKIRRHSGIVSKVGFEEVMARSVECFLSKKS